MSDYPLNAPRLEDMTEPELSGYLNHILAFIHANRTPDTVGAMLVIFQENRIVQYGATTINPKHTPDALRELADRIEKNQTVERNENGTNPEQN